MKRLTPLIPNIEKFNTIDESYRNIINDYLAHNKLPSLQKLLQENPSFIQMKVWNQNPRTILHRAFELGSNDEVISYLISQRQNLFIASYDGDDYLALAFKMARHTSLNGLLQKIEEEQHQYKDKIYKKRLNTFFTKIISYFNNEVYNTLKTNLNNGLFQPNIQNILDIIWQDMMNPQNIIHLQLLEILQISLEKVFQNSTEEKLITHKNILDKQLHHYKQKTSNLNVVKLIEQDIECVNEIYNKMQTFHQLNNTLKQTASKSSMKI